jgi:hypothetical protein
VRFVTVGVVLALLGGVMFANLTPSPSPGIGLTPTPSPVALPDSGDLEAGTTYYWDGEPWGVDAPRFIFTVPATGWSARNPGIFGKDTVTDPQEWHEILMTAWNVSNVMVDACRWLTEGQLDPPVGPTVGDLATALAQQAVEDASTPTDVSVGGYAGKRLELSLPPDLDIATCDAGEFWRWSEAGLKGGWIFANGQRNIIYILDVAGLRVLIDTVYMPGTSEADLAEVEQLVASMRFETATASPSPAP